MNEDTKSPFNFIVYMFLNQPSFLATTGGGGEEKFFLIKYSNIFHGNIASI